MAERILGPFQDGHVLGRGRETYLLPAPGSYGITVSIPDLKAVTWILKWSFRSTPIVSHGTVENEWVAGNVVGCTLIGVTAGTTLRVDAVAIGV